MKNEKHKHFQRENFETATRHILNECFEYLRTIEDGSQKIIPVLKKDGTLIDINDSVTVDELLIKINKLIFSQPEIFNRHARFLAWSVGAGRDIAVISGLIQNVLNAPVQTDNQILGKIERKTVYKLLEYIDLSKNFDGLFVSGASVSNLLGIANGRMNFDKTNQEQEGNSKLIITDETHISVKRAAKITGFKDKNILTIQTNNRTIDSELLGVLLKEKKIENVSTVCATFGSTTLGRFDDLCKLHEICIKHNIWLHVDASWGAWFRILEEKKILTRGLEFADSISIDMHKWPGLPIGTALFLFNKKNEIKVKNSFELNASYLDLDNEQTFKFIDYGIETTRPDRSLAAWILLQTCPLQDLKEELRYLCQIATYFTNKLKQKKQVIILSEPEINIVTFIYGSNGLPHINNTNLVKKALLDLNSKNFFVKSDMVENNLCIRVSFMNVKISQDDVNAMIDII